MTNFDPVILSLTALFMSTLSLMAVVAYGLKRLIDRPPAQYGPEVTSVESIFGRPDLPEGTVPLVYPRSVYGQRDGRCC